jgi:hypothetical protein
MRRFVFILIAIFASVFVAKSQPKALGLRAGMDCQLSYEHNMTGDLQGAESSGDFMELDLGVEFVYGYAVGLNAAAGYNFMIAQPEWTQKGQWGFYVGPAVKVGYLWVGGYLAVGAQVGLEYNFDFPLQLSLDIRPAAGVAFEGGTCRLYGAEAILGSIPCLSVRYRF